MLPTSYSRTFRTSALVLSAVTLIVGCGERRDRQGIRIGAGDTVAVGRVGDKSGERTKVGGGKSTEANQSLYLKENVSIETLRRQFVTSIPDDQKTKMIEVLKSQYLDVVVMSTIQSGKPAFQVLWKDPADKTKEAWPVVLTQDKTSSVYKGSSDTAQFQIACLSMSEDIVADENTGKDPGAQNSGANNRGANTQGSELCEVARLDIQQDGLSIPFLIISRLADVKNAETQLVLSPETDKEFVQLPDQRRRHHMILLAEAVKTTVVINTISVLSDQSLFGISMIDPSTQAKLQIWGDYRRVNQNVPEKDRIAVQSQSSPLRSQVARQAVLTDNQSDSLTIGFFYDVKSKAPTTTLFPVADENMVSLQFLLK